MWANNGGHNKREPGTEVWWENQKGYIVGTVALDDGSLRWVRQHRWLMEQHLGRELAQDEVVHHINGDKQDNRIENLEVMAHGEHSRHHNKRREYPRGYKKCSRK